jgi:Holliday junction resolvase
VLKNAKAKGARAERRAIRLLEAAGYYCTKAGGSLGVFDVIAIGNGDLRCIQVKAGSKYASSVEREQIRELRFPGWASKEIWRYPDRCREPLMRVRIMPPTSRRCCAAAEDSCG